MIRDTFSEQATKDTKITKFFCVFFVSLVALVLEAVARAVYVAIDYV